MSQRKPPNLINLDNLRTVRTVILNGVERKLRTMKVKEFINGGQWDERLENEKRPGARAQIICEMILPFMSNTELDELLDLEIDVLAHLMNFIRGTDDIEGRAEKVKEGAEAGEAGPQETTIPASS